MLAIKSSNAEWRKPSDLETIVKHCWQEEMYTPRPREETRYIRDANMRLESARLDKGYDFPVTWKFAARTGLFYGAGLSKFSIAKVMNCMPSNVLLSVNSIKPYIDDPDLRDFTTKRQNDFLDEWGMTKREFCESIGISVRTLRRYELGQDVQCSAMLDMIFVEHEIPTCVLTTIARKRYESIVRKELIYERYLMGD